MQEDNPGRRPRRDDKEIPDDSGLFMDRNNTDFPLSLVAGLNKLMLEWNPQGFIKRHQFIPIQYIINNPRARGLLICHGMGRGKTILAAALAWFLKKKYPAYKVIVLATLTLEDNFRGQVTKLLRISKVPDEEIEKFLEELNFVALNSGIMFKKLTKVGKTDEQLQFEEQLKGFQTKLDTEADFLEDTILVVDEAHRLFTSIANGSANAIQFYDTVMKTKHIKFFPLTGTPIKKTPFEMVPCYNMLGTQPGSPPLLPEILYDFENLFVDRVNSCPKNADILANRIMGLTSYYGSLYEEGTPPGFPHLEPTEVRKVPMSSYQWQLYAQARGREKEMSASGYQKKQAAKERFGRVDAVSTYRVASRQISNYAFPAHATVEETVPGYGGMSRTRQRDDPSLLKDEDVDEKMLAVYSPKMLEILTEIRKALAAGEKRLLFYSPFVHTCINVFAKVLNHIGWKEWQPASSEDETYGIGNAKRGNILRYVRITGESDVEYRDAARDHFNASEDITLVMISGTGTEGLNLFRGRVVLIAGSDWTYDTISQVIHRFYRFEGHKDLPLEQQRVRVVVFLSVAPEVPLDKEALEQKDEFGVPLLKQKTTDVDLWDTAIAAKAMNDKFVLIEIETSIDCAIFHPELPLNVQKKVKCHACAPNHKQLFNPNVVDDFKYPNACQPVKESQIKAKEILVDDTKYYYTFQRDPIKIQIFLHDRRVDGFVIMQQSHPMFQSLYQKILDFEMPQVEQM